MPAHATITTYGLAREDEIKDSSGSLNLVKIIIGDGSGVLTASSTSLNGSEVSYHGVDRIVDDEEAGLISVFFVVPLDAGAWSMTEFAIVDDQDKFYAVGNSAAAIYHPVETDDQAEEWELEIRIRTSNSPIINFIFSDQSPASQAFVNQQVSDHASDNARHKDNLPNAKSSSITTFHGEILATSRAVADTNKNSIDRDDDLEDYIDLEIDELKDDYLPANYLDLDDAVRTSKVYTINITTGGAALENVYDSIKSNPLFLALHSFIDIVIDSSVSELTVSKVLDFTGFPVRIRSSIGYKNRAPVIGDYNALKTQTLTNLKTNCYSNTIKLTGSGGIKNAVIQYVLIENVNSNVVYSVYYDQANFIGGSSRIYPRFDLVGGARGVLISSSSASVVAISVSHTSVYSITVLNTVLDFVDDICYIMQNSATGIYSINANLKLNSVYIQNNNIGLYSRDNSTDSHLNEDSASVYIKDNISWDVYVSNGASFAFYDSSTEAKTNFKFNCTDFNLPNDTQGIVKNSIWKDESNQYLIKSDASVASSVDKISKRDSSGDLDANTYKIQSAVKTGVPATTSKPVLMNASSKKLEVFERTKFYQYLDLEKQFLVGSIQFMTGYNFDQKYFMAIDGRTNVHIPSYPELESWYNLNSTQKWVYKINATTFGLVDPDELYIQMLTSGTLGLLAAGSVMAHSHVSGARFKGDIHGEYGTHGSGAGGGAERTGGSSRQLNTSTEGTAKNHVDRLGLVPIIRHSSIKV